MHFNAIWASAIASAALAIPAVANAHAIVGPRFLPATLAIDDPGVADELSLPVVSSFETSDDPAARELDISGEYSKRLTERLGLSVAGAWTRLHVPGEPDAEGFQNLETTLKYQLLKNPEHEAIAALGLSAEWGASGAARVGAERHTTLTPTVYFGRGAGDLPAGLGWARPLAVTGTVGYAIPTRAHEGGARTHGAVEWGLALEYSLPYLTAQVKDYGWPQVLTQLTPLVEASFETPTGRSAGRTTGTINPGVIWSGRRMQVGAEATVPINRESGRGVGVLLQIHFYLDDVFPRTIGRPIW